jgi:hypothetical protein
MRQAALNSVSFKNLLLIITCVCLTVVSVVQICVVALILALNYMFHHNLSAGAGAYLCASLADICGLGAFNSYWHAVLKEKQMAQAS